MKCSRTGTCFCDEVYVPNGVTCIHILCGGDGGVGGGGDFIAERMIDMVKICRSISHQ